MAFVEDLAPFFNVAEFADTATLDSVAVDGIFDADNVDPLDVESSGPAFTLPTAVGAAAVHGSTLVITTGLGSGTWKVREIKDDGTGVRVLKLERQ